MSAAVESPAFDTCVRRVARIDTQALAAPVETLRKLALSSSPPRPARAVYVWSSAGGGPVTPGDRDLFWRVFQVPVFEQLLSSTGGVLAEECHAHEGMHVLCRMEDLPPCHVTHEPCECGRPGARILNQI